VIIDARSIDKAIDIYTPPDVAGVPHLRPARHRQGDAGASKRRVPADDTPERLPL